MKNGPVLSQAWLENTAIRKVSVNMRSILIYLK